MCFIELQTHKIHKKRKWKSIFHFLGQTKQAEMDLRFLICISQKRMSEPPFVSREKLIEKQKNFQSIYKHTYLKGPYDKITSVVIPLALAASSMYLIGRGIYNMSHGIGKKE
ncbi:hypothetical protein Ancab_014036 [Ancistrocladus abbreviatus]